jgi:predicted O-methyltransferase YrrM
MEPKNQKFVQLLEKATYNAENYILYSPSQITRGDHLQNNLVTGERAWSIPESTGQFLYTLITKLGLKTGLELGTSVGYSTLWIAAGLANNTEQPQMITIEKNPEKSTIAQATLAETFPFITFRSGMIGNYLPLIPANNQFDFIFMDADRGNYMNYWPYIKSFMHKKSIVVIDNALRVQKSVQEFQTFLKNDPSLKAYLYPIDNGLFLVSLADGEYDLHKLILDI